MPDKRNLYSGHKVVAMPTGPLGVPSHHERFSPHKGDDSSVSSYHSRASRRSTGRGARDIVQDVYDRMGVNYIRGRPSIESLLQGSKELGDIVNSTNAKSEPGTGFQRSNTRHSEFGTATSTTMGAGTYTADARAGARDRPVSRGRLSTQWPPVGTSVSVDNEESHSRTVMTGKTPTNLSEALPTKPRTTRSYLQNFKTDDQRDDGKNSDVLAPDDERDEISIVSAKSTMTSVRERVGLFGGSASVSRISTGPQGNARHSFGTGASAVKQRSYPPMVDVYDSVSVSNNKNEIEVSIDALSTIDQSSCIGGARRHSSDVSISRRSMADAYLSAVTNKPHIHTDQEISSPRAISRNIEFTAKDLQVNDAASVAASSVSGEDFTPATPKRSWGKTPSSLGKITSESTNSASIEKQIEERVHSQVSMMFRKFEAEIRRVENRIDHECKLRIQELERKNQELSALLAQARGDKTKL